MGPWLEGLRSNCKEVGQLEHVQKGESPLYQEQLNTGGKGKGWGERRQRNKCVILSSDVVNLQEATALGHMQGC